MFKKLKSLFIVEEGISDASTESSSPEVQSDSATTTFSSTADLDTLNSEVTKKGIDKFVNHLLKALDAAGQDGFDYLEFKNSVKSLENLNMDEETMFKSALAMAKTMGAEKSSLESSAKYYLSILASEKQKINDAYIEKVKSDQTETEKHISRLSDTIKSKADQLKKLELEIKQHSAELEKYKSEQGQNAQKAKVTLNEFEKAYQMINGQIAGDLEKLEKYLK